MVIRFDPLMVMVDGGGERRVEVFNLSPPCIIDGSSESRRVISYHQRFQNFALALALMKLHFISALRLDRLSLSLSPASS